MSRILNWLSYYRASLIDASRGNKDSILEKPLWRSSSTLLDISKKEMEIIWENKKTFKLNLKVSKTTHIEKEGTAENSGIITEILKESTKSEKREEITINKIEIAPIFITVDVVHGAKNKNIKKLLPFWIPAYVSETGVLYPPKEGEMPSFLRNYLAPNPKDFPAIASMEVLDKKLKSYEINTENWTDYWSDCEKFFKSVTNKKFTNYQDSETHQFSISKAVKKNANTNIIALYNDLVFDKDLKKQKYPVLEKLLQEKEDINNHKLSNVEVFLNDNHFGQMNDEFPLSSSQRLAFAQYVSKHNQVAFAINGPPGTGKTTILQSIIANTVSNAVLDKKNAPLMVGCSTNNQAITNILDSMQYKESTDLLANRWLPNVKSFGLYLCALNKSGEASKKYHVVTNSYLNDGFINKLDDKSKYISYEDFFISKFRDYFKSDIVDESFDFLSYLRQKIEALKLKINTSLEVTSKKFNSTYTLESKGFKNYEALIDYFKNAQDAVQKSKERCEKLQEIQSKLVARNSAFPIYVKLLPFQRFRIQRANAFKQIAHPFYKEFSENFKWYNHSLLNSEFELLLFTNLNSTEKLTIQLAKIATLKNEIDRTNKSYLDFKTKWINTYEKKWKNLIAKTGSEYSNLDLLEDTAVKLDISYRYELFWFSIHYREWEFIQELKQKKTGLGAKEREKNSYQSKLRRLAKVTPLFISTFHTLPKFSNYYSNNKKINYFTNLYDLMIVDEAGQVSPEIAIPSLSFTKKILAVGDIYQIEPVWSVVKGVDYLNAKKYKVITNEEEFKVVDVLGFMASNGSLMKMIKKASQFSFKHSNGESEKGAYLIEHRRCLNSIIEYSKDNVYNGSLKLMAGSKHNKNHDLPPLGYIHVAGTSEKHYGNSRKNIKEAHTIIQWVLNNKDMLANAYNKQVEDKADEKVQLHDVLAIITPFSAQRELLKQLAHKYLGKPISDKLIIGTVHALQGAEKPIILFSMVHDQSDKTLFFDYEGKFNMLNVAITRAKHSFIAIGNMAILNPTFNSPSGKLGAKLFSDEAYSLSDTFIYQSNIVYLPDDIDRIDTLEKHRNALEKCFKIAKKELIIFSPFISIRAIEADKIITLINETTKRGVKITILTDKFLDEFQNKLKDNSIQGRKAIATTEANLVIVNGIHSKTICVDDKIIIEGSFNWFSAARNINSPYCRDEVSVIIQGHKIKDELKKIKLKYNL